MKEVKCAREEDTENNIWKYNRGSDRKRDATA